jgi:hypothetical protein
VTVSIKIQRYYGSGRHYYVSLRKNKHHWHHSGPLDDVLKVRDWIASKLQHKRFKKLFRGGSKRARHGFMICLSGVFISLNGLDRWNYDDNN